MGVVLGARHVQLGQRVAIKFMRGEAAHEPSAVSRFLREARAAVALSSEHVAKVLDVGTLATGEPYMVLEYLAGVDLGKVLRSDGPLAVDEAVGTVLQACEAIAEAHVLGIVHRDLKPSNLFRTTRRDGSLLIKVLDFGISKTVALNTPGSGESLTASGLLMGSPGYMSPEQLRSAKAVDARSDIWSLGVILYELLIGEPPFTGETMGETFARILSESAPPIRRRRPEVPEGLAAVVARCLERDVERRVQTVGHLAVLLAPFAPRHAALSVERIARIAGTPALGALAAAEAAPNPDTMTALPSSGDSGEAYRGRPGVDTSPAWLRSGPIARLRPGGRAVVIAASLATVLALLGIAAVVYSLGNKPAVPTALTNSVEPAAVAPAAVATAKTERIAPPLPLADPAMPGRMDEAEDASPPLSQRSLIHPSPARSEPHHVAPPHPPPKSSTDNSFENLMEQRR
jgi:eukaryotic-like serine/threonine-protein kinase